MTADYLEIFSPATFNRFKSNGLRISVVGNAGGLTKRDHEIIRSSDCVIRFNNYATREGINRTNDRFQCDILFTTGDLHSEGSQPTFVVLAIPLPFHMDTGVLDRMNRWYPKSKLYMPNPYWNYQACLDLGLESLGSKHPLPTAGFTALYHIFKLTKAHPNFQPEVFVTGFDFYYNNGKIQKHWDIENRNYPKGFNHRYGEEIRWIISNLMPDKHFSFGERMMQILLEMKERV